MRAATSHVAQAIGFQWPARQADDKRRSSAPRGIARYLRLATLVLALLFALSGSASAADQTQADRGREIYQKWCTPCHGTGLGKPGTAAAAAHGAKPAVLEQRTDLTPKMIETAVRSGVNFMPRFRRTEISNTDLAALVAYLMHK